MKIHLKIIAVLHLLLGSFMLLGQILSVYAFFNSSLFRFDNSIFNTSISFFQRISDNYHYYLEFLAIYGLTGIDVLIAIIWVILLFSFGFGLLKLNEWARKLGFLIIALNVCGFCMAIYYNYLSFSYIIGILFAFYMVVILSSEKSKILFIKQ